MDFRFSEEELALRKEIADFARKELPEDWQGGFEYGDEYCAEFWPFTKEIAKKLGRQGWLGMAWTEAYGGTNRPLMSQLIYYEEMVYFRIPAFDMGIGGICNVGPLINLFGTEEQKRRHLPNLASGIEFWCVGYSEPNAGSDLNFLNCRARRNNGRFTIKGEKIWTSAAQIADWCWLLTRTGTEGKQGRGLSIFLVPMNSKGIIIQPINNMAGHPSFNQVFFDDVEVGEDNVLGGINGAWNYMPILLTLERTFSGAASVARSRRMLDEVINYMQGHRNFPEISRLIFRHRLAELAIEVEAGRLLAYHAAWLRQLGNIPYPEASMVRAYSSQLEQKTAATAMEALGLFSQLRNDSAWVKLKGQALCLYLSCISESILGGTTEIQKNIIAVRRLGLPRQ